MRSLAIKEWKKDPHLSAIVQATFPDYRRRVVYVQAAISVYLHDLNWSGGTRNEYRACTVPDIRGNVEFVGSTDRYNNVDPWVNLAEGKEMPIPPGKVVVRGGMFCGKTSALQIYINPADMPRRLEGAFK